MEVKKDGKAFFLPGMMAARIAGNLTAVPLCQNKKNTNLISAIIASCFT